MKEMPEPQVSLDPSSKNARTSRREVVSLKAKAAMERSWLEVCSDWLASSFGTITFLILNMAWFGAWMFFNSGIFKNVTAFDPYPFNLLTMVVSLEAIFLSIIVLISQNRASRIDELRQEIDLQVNIIAEQEVTKIMGMLAKLMKCDHLNVSHDKVLKEMLKPIDRQKIEEELSSQL